MIPKSLNLDQIPKPADQIISQLVTGILNIAVDFVQGIYLTGSIAVNDFHPDKSDIDFIVICNELPGKEIERKLTGMHNDIAKRFKTPSLSGRYLALGTVERTDPTDEKVLTFHEGRMSHGSFDMAIVTLYELKTVACTIHGVPAGDLPIKIDLEDVQHFLYNNINSYWRNWLRRHSPFHIRYLLLLLIPRLTEWAVLGVARQLYTLQTGKITSKTDAGYFCLTYLPRKYHNIIHTAIRIRADHRFRISIKPSYYISMSQRRATETLSSLNFIINLFNRSYTAKHNKRQ